MNPDELVWRIEEAEEELRALTGHPDEDACHIVQARITALKNQLAAEVNTPSLGATPLERVRRPRPEL